MIGAIARAYVAPRAAMARELDAGPSEGRAFFHLLAACVLGAAATLPDALEVARALPQGEARAGIIPAHLFGFVFVAPLLMYGIAALVHLGARVFGGRGGFLGARMAVFWSLLLAGPMALALAIAAAAGAGAWLRVAVAAASAYWLWLLAASLAEAEGFATTARVAAVLAAVAALVATALWGVGGSAPVAA